MAQHLFALLDPCARNDILSFPLHPLFPCPELDAALLLPRHVRVAAVVGKAPKRMHSADLGLSIETLPSRRRAAELGVEGVGHPWRVQV